MSFRHRVCDVTRICDDYYFIIKRSVSQGRVSLFTSQLVPMFHDHGWRDSPQKQFQTLNYVLTLELTDQNAMKPQGVLSMKAEGGIAAAEPENVADT